LHGQNSFSGVKLVILPGKTTPLNENTTKYKVLSGKLYLELLKTGGFI